jgi:hypothetical protein
MLAIDVSILALVSLISTLSDPFGTGESKPDCNEIEKNDEFYIEFGYAEWIQECRNELIENFTGEDEEDNLALNVNPFAN